MQHARSAVASLLVAGLGAALVAAPALAGPAQAPILGGNQTTPGQYPSTLVIEVGGGMCSATLLTPDWVLTAAHCVSPSVVGGTQAQITAGMKVHVGTINLRTSGGTIVRASQTIPHPSFSINNLGSHDIGLIKLATPITDVVPLPINLIAARAPVGVGVTMVGFGATATGGGGNIGVQYAVHQTSVSCAADGASDAYLLCYDQTSGLGKCQGDSGGPSFATLDGKLVQVGITSFGDQNCAQFGADTRTDAERDFLFAHVPALACGADGACTAGCGQAGLPIDPDCPVCDDDSQCPGSRICHEHQCLVAPFDPTGVGSACTGGEQCESGECAGRGDQQLCVLSCTPGAADACPSGFDCANSAGGGGACWPASGGCCDAGQRGAPTALVGVLVIGAALTRRRRRA